ncbi:4-coumarate--CoA ligase 3-like [Harmonia axyridis]|uniref:4-coumarate--CoA ligase 3-like n=1 Tax=Harmonia axyridis TaxID=115357 RepID=UPI001E2784D8|nr:4-coumarate--CoA ligase 3-like [Harmonia axyridis]
MFVLRCVKKKLSTPNLKKLCRRNLVNNISSEYVVNSGQSDLIVPNVTLPEFLTQYQNKFENFIAIVLIYRIQISINSFFLFSLRPYYKYNFKHIIFQECAETKKKYTFGQLRDKSTTLGKSLRKRLKLKDGDVVAIILRNIPEFPIINLGIMKANLIVSPVSSAFTSEEISRQIQDSGAKAIITEVVIHPNIRKALRIARRKIPVLVVKTERDQSIPESTINIEEFIDGKVDYPEIILGQPDDVVLMPYSSGTTGLPKGVELTHKNIISSALQTCFCDNDFQKEASGTHQEILPTILPYYHIFGQAIIYGSSLVGGKMIAMRNFSPELFITTLKDNKSTILYIVPPLVLMLTYHEAVKKEYLECVSAILSGGAPFSASDERAFIDKFGNKIHFLQGYGMTESACSASYLYPSIMEKMESYRGSIGRPLPNTLMKVVNPEDPNLTALGPNTIGELLIKGPQVMKSYHNLPEETKNTITENNWLRSGDLGYYNEDGFFFIADRLKELIKVKGNQVAPAELEAVIRSYPGIADAAVIGIPHRTSGEVPRAYVVAGEELNVEKLNEFVNEKVARYKQLKGGIAVVDSIPKNASGKILRKEIKEAYLKEIAK